MNSVWRRIPVAGQAVALGFLVLLGNQVWQLLFGANLKHNPRVAWSVPIGAAFLWLFSRYLGGGGPPRRTAEARRQLLRAEKVESLTWKRALAFGGVGWAGLLVLEVALLRYMRVPQESPLPPSMPVPTAVLFALMTATNAGIVEESSFRGYLQGPIERRHGPLLAILVSSMLFWLSHAGAYAGHWSFFLLNSWFYLGAGVLFGFLAFATGSILPGVVLHVSADLAGLGLQWWSSILPAVGAKAGGSDTVVSMLLWLGCTCIVAAVILGRRLIRRPE